MIRFIPYDYSQTAWDNEAAGFEGVSLLQSWGWGAAKLKTRSWGVERGVLRDGERTVGMAQVMVRSLPVVGGGLAWIARGPLYASGAARRYPELIGALRRHYVDERRLHLRIAPAIPASDIDESVIQAAGFRLAGASGWVSAVVDLSAATEVIRRGLGQKWRNGLNKAERLGLLVEEVSATAKFSGFLDEYRAFLSRRDFETTVTPDLLKDLQPSLGPEHGMRAWRCSREGQLLAGVLIARYGGRAEYLVGILTDTARPYAAGQLVLWRALLAEKEAGMRWFDLGGMDPALTPEGVRSFKAGLGGMPYQLAREIEADDSGLRSRLVRWRITRARANTSRAS